MGALVYFGIGLSTGLVLAWILWWHSRREIYGLEEDKQRLRDERIIVADFMHDLIEAIGRGVSRAELLQQVVQAAVASSGAMSACVFERSGRRLQGVAMQGLFPPHRPLPESVRRNVSSRTAFLEQVLRAEVFEVGEGLVGLVAQSGKGILIADAENDPRVIKHDDPALRVRSVIVVPITFRNQNLAVLAIVNRSDGLPFDEIDFSLATGLAEQAALALQNLALMDDQIERNRLESDLSLASNIQSLLLPSKFPSTDKLDIAALYKPAQKVGGDLYDVIQIDEHRFGVAVADVAGKGIPASLIMAITQSNLSHFSKREVTPVEVLRGLNEVLFTETQPEMFVTLVYALIDLKAETVTVVRAGHETPLLWRTEDDDAEALKPRGMAVGLVPDRLFARSLAADSRPFRPGDTLFLFTDGIVEATDMAGEEFGGDRLRRVFTQLHGSVAEGINRGVLETVEEWAGTRAQVDDVTLLCVKRRH